MGMAFSAVLDSSNPPLFSELGNVDLTPAEAWHPSCIASFRQAAASKETGSLEPSQP